MTFTALPAVAAFEHRDAAVGFEVAFFRTSSGGCLVEGSTSGVEDGEPYTVDYAIELDARWRTRRAVLRGRSSRGAHATELLADGAGGWSVDGAPAPELSGCPDVDLEGSAVTNAFPVRRLALAVGDRAEAPAAYVRSRDLRVERLEQGYARLDDARDGRVRFDYVSERFDTRCLLEYDRTGLVLAYPGIAVRRL